MDGADHLNECSACGRRNPSTAATCLGCGAPLSTVEQVLDRQRAGRQATWLEHARAQAGELKSREARSSELRMETFREIDRAREQANLEAQARQVKRDRRLLFVAGGALGLFLLFLCMISIVFLLRSG